MKYIFCIFKNENEKKNIKKYFLKYKKKID